MSEDTVIGRAGQAVEGIYGHEVRPNLISSNSLTDGCDSAAKYTVLNVAGSMHVFQIMMTTLTLVNAWKLDDN